MRSKKLIKKNLCFLKLKDYRDIDKHFCIIGVINAKVVCYPYRALINPRTLMLCFALSTESINNKIFLLYYGDFIRLNLIDQYFFVFCKEKGDIGQVLIPDPDAYFDENHLLHSLYLKAKVSKFNNRLSEAYWRGATTGGNFNDKSWINLPRAKLVSLSLEYPKYINAKFTRLVQGAVIDKFGLSNRYLAPESSSQDFLRYKFLIDVDGNSNSWTRLRQLLVSGGVILKQDSNFEQWYYSLLKNNENCLFFKNDCTDLIEKISYAMSNQYNCMRIIQNQFKLYNKYLRPESARDFLKNTINKYGIDI